MPMCSSATWGDRADVRRPGAIICKNALVCCGFCGVCFCEVEFAKQISEKTEVYFIIYVFRITLGILLVNYSLLR